MKEKQLEKKKAMEVKAVEKRKKIHQIMKAKEDQEKETLAQYLDKQHQDIAREEVMKKEKAKAMMDIRLMAEEKEVKKQKILKQAEERMEEKIQYWLEKQKIADKRLERQKEKEKFKEIIRKEFITLNNQSKYLNKRRFIRKKQYEEEKMRDKLFIEDLKIEAMADQRSQLKEVRQRALEDMERQRQDIRQALYHMTVWNSFSPRVVKTICDPKARMKENVTIDEMVRVHASIEHRKKALRKKRRRTNSVVNVHQVAQNESAGVSTSNTGPQTHRMASHRKSMDDAGPNELHRTEEDPSEGEYTFED